MPKIIYLLKKYGYKVGFRLVLSFVFKDWDWWCHSC